MVFLIIKGINFLRVIEYVNISIKIKENLTFAIADFIIVATMLEGLLGLKIPATLSLATFLVLTVEVELSLKRTATPPLANEEQ